MTILGHEQVLVHVGAIVFSILGIDIVLKERLWWSGYALGFAISISEIWYLLFLSCDMT